MKIVLTLLVRDEEDILEDNLLFHLNQGVDFVIVTDNHSRDGSRDILESYALRKVVRIIDEPDDDYSQDRWVTRMAGLAATEHGADWVINSDADEFWWPRQGTLADALRGQPPEVGGVRVERCDFPPSAETEGPFHRRMQAREVRSRNALGDPLPPKVCHRAAADVAVAQGNHSVYSGSLGPTVADSSLLIFHFPLRSWNQFEHKIRIGGAAYARNQRLGAEVGATWRRLYDRLLQGKLRDYYESRVIDRARLDAGIAEGSLILDRRLHLYLRGAQWTAGPPSVAPAPPVPT